MRLARILLFIAFIVFAYPVVNDPDFGWHLAAGKYYVEQGAIPHRDIFSYTMSDYSWVNHEYASDALYYVLYLLGGTTTILISVLFLGIGLLFYLVLFPQLFPKTLATEEKLLMGFIALMLSRPFWGVRSQVFDWIGMAGMFLIWNYAVRTRSWVTLWWIPILFFVWANVHGGFLIGLMVLSMLVFFEIISRLKPAFVRSAHRQSLTMLLKEYKHTFITFLMIVVGSLAATFLTPYGYDLHSDIWNTVTNQAGRSMIAEWQPVSMTSPHIFPFWLYFVFFILFLAVGDKFARFSPQEAVLLIFFLLMAFSSVRFIPFFVLVSLPMLYGKFFRFPLFVPLLAFAVFTSFFVSGILPARGTSANVISPLEYLLTADIYSSGTPAKAFAYLKEHYPDGHVFNEYDWGGDLIWSFPGAKTFIDGRMSYWRQGGRSIPVDYAAIYYVQQGWYKKIEEYDIRWFFLKPEAPVAGALDILTDQWEKKYEDQRAVIFVKRDK